MPSRRCGSCMCNCCRTRVWSLQQQVEAILRGNAAEAVSQVASTKLGLAGYTLMVLNITLFVVGAAASFLRHDPHPDYEAAWHTERRGRARLTRTRVRFESRLDAAQKDHDTRVRALDELLRRDGGQARPVGRAGRRRRAVLHGDGGQDRQLRAQPIPRVRGGRLGRAAGGSVRPVDPGHPGDGRNTPSNVPCCPRPRTAPA